jgi:hypothetical protein
MPKSVKPSYSSPKLKAVEPEDEFTVSLKMLAGAVASIAKSYDRWVDLQREMWEAESEEPDEVEPATVGTAEYKSDDGDEEEDGEEEEEPHPRFASGQAGLPTKSS